MRVCRFFPRGLVSHSQPRATLCILSNRLYRLLGLLEYVAYYGGLKHIVRYYYRPLTMPYSADIRAGFFRISLNTAWLYQWFEDHNEELRYYDGSEWVDANSLINNDDITLLEERVECALQSQLDRIFLLNECNPTHLFTSLIDEVYDIVKEYPDKFRIFQTDA